ncbi:hypothetical protein [Hymenobacter sp. GOD-10R]|uniref:hypothetical protein n=1 Tax=Hymenobacter sp. GOD-10R TaxID=3093922 RepID=UPI002D793AB6|nr:hypothetical protein [Hymenobacter sp. GOD-10R]WRQ26669.1 hypothetical protein SD425_16475 [Hymenobacter sp. GOD-10R]
MGLLSTIQTWLKEALELPISIRLKNPRPLDAWYGPYDSIADAVATVPQSVRFNGRTVGVIIGGECVDHAWGSDLTNAGLKPKAGGTGAGGPLDVVDLDINGGTLLVTRRSGATKSLNLPTSAGGDPNADDVTGAQFDEPSGKLTITTADEIYTVYIRNIGLNLLSQGLQNIINGKAEQVHTHLSSAITDFAEAVQDAVAAFVQESATIAPEVNDLAGTLKLNVKPNSIGEDLLSAAVRFKLNATAEGSTGLNVSKLTFTWTAANPSVEVPETAFDVLLVKNTRGRVLDDDDYVLNPDTHRLTVLATGAREGDKLRAVLLLGTVAPDPDPDPDPPTGTPAAPGAATQSGTTSSVPLVTGYSSPAAYEAEPISSAAPPAGTTPAAPAMATSSGTTTSVPLVANYSTPDQYEAATV